MVQLVGILILKIKQTKNNLVPSSTVAHTEQKRKIYKTLKSTCFGINITENGEFQKLTDNTENSMN